MHSVKILTIKNSGIYIYSLKNVKTIHLLLKIMCRNEYVFYFFNFNPIECSFFKNVQIAFLNFKGHFLKMTLFQTSNFCELAEFGAT